MKQANELRIGNYVNYYHNGEYNRGKITSLNKKTLTIDNKVVLKYKSHYGNGIVPIQLTKEIITENCGLQLREVTIDGKKQTHYSDFKKIAIEVLGEYTFFFCIHQGFEEVVSIKKIQYLHELQNLYQIICETELEIKF